MDWIDTPREWIDNMSPLVKRSPVDCIDAPANWHNMNIRMGMSMDHIDNLSLHYDLELTWIKRDSEEQERVAHNRYSKLIDNGLTTSDKKWLKTISRFVSIVHYHIMFLRQ